MKPYKILPCENYDAINAEILKFLKQHTELLKTVPRLYANFIDLKNLFME